MTQSVQRDKKNRKVQFSDNIQINKIDYKEIRPKTASTDSVVFSIDFTDVNNVFHDNQLLLDTCAGESVFRTKSLFYEIAKSLIPTLVSGVNSKGKPLVITECGNTDFGVVYYDPNCIANILSLGNKVNNCFSVTYSNKQDFYNLQVRKGGCCYYFHRDVSSNIYICDLDSMVSRPKKILVTTVHDKMKKYTVRQVKQAEIAREHQRKLGYSSPGQLIKLIGQGKLVNGTVTAQDL